MTLIKISFIFATLVQQFDLNSFPATLLFKWRIAKGKLY